VAAPLKILLNRARFLIEREPIGAQRIRGQEQNQTVTSAGHRFR
jgi:hypothetical protein